MLKNLFCCPSQILKSQVKIFRRILLAAPAVTVLTILALPPLLFVARSVRAEARESSVYVQVKSSKLRAEPHFWAAPIAELQYGAQLVAMGAASSDKSWLQVKSGGQQGYVHVSAVTSRKVVVGPQSGGQKTSVDSGSVVLAGKGFNKQVESSYGSSKGVNFAGVDEVEQNKVDLAEGAAFIRDGKLVTR